MGLTGATRVADVERGCLCGRNSMARERCSRDLQWVGLGWALAAPGLRALWACAPSFVPSSSSAVAVAFPLAAARSFSTRSCEVFVRRASIACRSSTDSVENEDKSMAQPAPEAP